LNKIEVYSLVVDSSNISVSESIIEEVFVFIDVGTVVFEPKVDFSVVDSCVVAFSQSGEDLVLVPIDVETVVSQPEMNSSVVDSV